MNAPRTWLRPLLGAGLALLCGWPASGSAQDLLTVWRAVEQHDPAVAVARAEHAASQTQRDRADALLRPRVTLGLGAGLGAADARMDGARFSAPGFGAADGANFATSIHGGVQGSATLSVQQALIDRGRDATRAQLELGADMGGIAWRAAKNDLFLRTAERYFALALAEERVRVDQQQLAALQRTAAGASERFKIGESPITDTYEANAAAASVRAELESGRLALTLARQKLSDSSGLARPEASLPVPPDALPAPALQTWVDSAQAQNLQVQLAQHQVALAERDLERRRAANSPTVNLVGQAGYDQLAGNGDFGYARNRNTNAMVGVQIKIPLYDGGMGSAEVNEGAHLLEKAQAALDQARDATNEQVRAAWSSWESGQERLRALQDALKASSERLEATRLGLQVGDRTTQDVLNAEKSQAQTELELARARIDQAMALLRLAALADRLDEAVVAQIRAVPTPAAIRTAPVDARATGSGRKSKND